MRRATTIFTSYTCIGHRLAAIDAAASRELIAVGERSRLEELEKILEA